MEVNIQESSLQSFIILLSQVPQLSSSAEPLQLPRQSCTASPPQTSAQSYVAFIVNEYNSGVADALECDGLPPGTFR